MFQSTYLYKVRLSAKVLAYAAPCFNPRTYIRYDLGYARLLLTVNGFNPRTYIRYDLLGSGTGGASLLFQSTYLYKVRQTLNIRRGQRQASFNPRTYIRYDFFKVRHMLVLLLFQSTYLYKVRRFKITFTTTKIRFNPRTYIRYDHRR